MNAAVTSMGAITKQTAIPRSSSLNLARRVAVACAVVGGAAVLAVLDAPQTRSSARALTAPSSALAAEAPALEGSHPMADASGIPGRAPLIVWFTRPMDPASLSAQSVTLVGPTGVEPARVAPLGAMAIIQPRNELLPASRYTLFIKGATDADQRPLPLSAIGFDTAAKLAGVSGAVPPLLAAAAPTVLAGAASQTPGNGAIATAGAPTAAAGAPPPADALTTAAAQGSDARTDDDAQLPPLGVVERLAVAQADAIQDLGDWIPGPQHFKGRWRADRGPSPLQSLPPLQAATGTTALSGQVLGMNGRAVRGVTLRVGDHENRTDRTGRFLLEGLTPGFAKMEIDTTANRGDAFYGYYAARIELLSQRTTIVPYTIWMPRLDPAGTVHIAAPTTAETIVRSPRIPGLELHIPAGTVIRDREGQIVTELNLTAIPVDRPPFPVPDLGVPVYFTIQPGGAVLQSVTSTPSPGARLFYPNFRHEVPGARGTFWNYDPEDREWFVYGLGTISPNATQAIPDEGVVIHELTGAMFNGGNTPGPEGSPPCGNNEDCGMGGDPVALATGHFNHVEHDAFLPDVIPIDITRTYANSDLNQRSFGIGMVNSYDIFLYSKNQWQEVDLILPSGTRVHYVRTSPGTDFATAVLQSSAPGIWSNSIVARNQARAGWDLLFRDGRKWFFPQFQPLTEISDRNGNVLHIVRESNNGTSGKIVQIMSPNGRSVDFVYNSAGFVNSITDNAGRAYSYTYDSSNRLTAVTDPSGGTRSYTWDTSNRMLAIYDANGNLVVQNQYESSDSGLVTHQDLANGGSYDYAYSFQPCPEPKCITSGGTTVCIVYFCADPSQRIDQVDVTDPRGTVRRVVFGPRGHVISDTYALGLPEEQVVHYEYGDGFGDFVSAMIDPLNRRTEYQYDSAGNITRVTRMAGTDKAASWNTTWDAAFAQPLTIVDPNENVSTMTYDTKGNLLTLQNAPGEIWTYTYDAQGRRVTSTDPLGKTTTFGYDGGDLARVVDPVGQQAQFLTDAVGRPTGAIDPLGNRWVKHWDDLDRPAGSIDPIGGVTSFSYDAKGDLLTHTDAKGHTTSYAYNVLNQVTSARDPRSKEASFLYEIGGRIAQVTDRNGEVRTMSYDALGRLKTLRLGASISNPTAFTSTIENNWDAAGRLILIIDRSCREPIALPNCGAPMVTSVITRAYDEFDHMIQEVTPQGEVDYTYDSTGRRTSMTIKNGPFNAQVIQPTITYSYDAASRLISITQAAGAINGSHVQTVSLTYDAAGHRTRTALANGVTVDYSYDDAGKATAIVYTKSDGTLIGDLQYSYDAAGRRTSVGGSLARMNLPTADIADATYDAGDRLLTWSGKNYQYDDQGRLVTDGDSDYQWNDRSRLAGIRSAGAVVASFHYDSVGRRIDRTIGSVTTGYLYDHEAVVQELSGSTNNSSIRAHLLTGGVDEVFLRLEGNAGANLQNVISDVNNNELGLIGAAQEGVVNYTYEPYGATTADAVSDNSQQYAGRENDKLGNGQDLYYYRARYYMPKIGRFIANDPIGWASGQTNNYAYVGGNPVGFRDPSGLDAQDNLPGEDFSAGLGDTLTFGATRGLRQLLGIDGVNTHSGWYMVGGIVPMVAPLAEGAVVADALFAEEAAAAEEGTNGAKLAEEGTPEPVPAEKTDKVKPLPWPPPPPALPPPPELPPARVIPKKPWWKFW